jgi:D-cysteine desulfhydrase
MTMRRIHLAHLPTPLFHSPTLDDLVGTELWVKLDDSNAGPASGNKIRKLEYILPKALDEGATRLITCGGEQSNHARATALAGARLGLKTLLLLRTSDPNQPPADTGNLLLNRMAGAEIQFITPEQYQVRDRLMLEAQTELGRAGSRAHVIPEGGSNGLGALGWVEAMHEVRRQLDLGLARGVSEFDAVVHACGSGGTAAGCVLGAAVHRVAETVIPMAVCDDSATFDERIRSIIAEARTLEAGLTSQAELRVLDHWKGPAYGVATEEQLRFIVAVARCSGLILDPVYTGKALFGLHKLQPKPRRVLFLHTGGLPGLLAQCSELATACSNR